MIPSPIIPAGAGFGDKIGDLISTLAQATARDLSAARVKCFVLASTRALNAERDGNDRLNDLYAQLAYHSLRGNGPESLALARHVCDIEDAETG